MAGVLDPPKLLELYRAGVFPMATEKDAHWIEIIDPPERGILPLKGFHVPKRLRRRIRQQPYEIGVNTAFAQTIDACAEITTERDETWINDGIINLYCALHKQGYAHSIETWHDGQLVGGLYGIAIGGAFFGESMFSRADDASKIALVHLVAGLNAMGFELLDAQFYNPHLTQFGLITITRDDFQLTLKRVLGIQAQFSAPVVPTSGSLALQEIIQTS